MRESDVAGYIADQVRLAMKRRGITQQALADMIGWRQPRVGRRLTKESENRVDFTAAELWIVSRALGESVEGFYPTGVGNEEDA